MRPGDRLLVDDGKIDLRVLDVDGDDITCEVLQGGPVSDHKGISLPGVAVSVPPLSEKDIEDLKFALELGVDMVAMSFVRAPEEVKLAHAIMDEVGKWVPVMAKLEKPEAVSDLPAIVDAFDGLMVARGDLGVEMPLEQVPLVQKRAIGLCRQAAKPVIVATQMLDSMISDRRPTRAEVSDVANAVFDGADAVMLSAETSVGAYPAHTVATMARIVEAAEDVPRQGAAPEWVAEDDATTRRSAMRSRRPPANWADDSERRRCAASPVPVTRRCAWRASDRRCRCWPSRTTSRCGRGWRSPGASSPPCWHPRPRPKRMPTEVSRGLAAMGMRHPGSLVVVVSGSRSGVAGCTDSVRVLRIE